MIIGVSIVDKHRPEGQRHVGTYMFEIDYPADSHFDLLTAVCLPDQELSLRPKLGRLITKVEMLQDAVRFCSRSWPWKADTPADATERLAVPEPKERIPEVFGSNANDICPRCGNVSLPRFRGLVTAVACQAPGCEYVSEKTEVKR